MSSSEHIQYATQLVTLPIVTARDCQYPDRIGPWRIRRTQSVPNSSTVSFSESSDDRSELKGFLEKVDEQCSQIENIARLDIRQQTETISVKDRLRDVEMGASFRGDDPIFPSNCWLTGLSLLCIVIIVADHITTFALGQLYGDLFTPRLSNTALCAWMSVTGFAFGWTLTINILLIKMVDSGQRMTRKRLMPRAVIALFSGIMIGCMLLFLTLQKVRNR